MIRFRCLDNYVNTKLLAHLDLLSNAIALQNGGGVGGAQRPPFEKHGQRSEHTSFLTVDRLFFFAIVLALRNSGGWGVQPPPICKTWMKIATRISSCTPLMNLYCNVFCVCLLYEIAVICNMLTLPGVASTRIRKIRLQPSRSSRCYILRHSQHVLFRRHA